MQAQINRGGFVVGTLELGEVTPEALANLYLDNFAGDEHRDGNAPLIDCKHLTVFPILDRESGQITGALVRPLHHSGSGYYTWDWVMGPERILR